MSRPYVPQLNSGVRRRPITQQMERMRVPYLAILATVIMGSGCARQRAVNIMMVEWACDTVPRPLAPGDQVGGTVPGAVAVVAERGILVGVVQEAGTRRVLQGSRVRLYRGHSDTERVQVGKDVSTNASGGFVLEPQEPGSYALAISRIGYRAYTQSVTLRAGVVDTIHAALSYQRCIGY